MRHVRRLARDSRAAAYTNPKLNDALADPGRRREHDNPRDERGHA
jgi:hypothetical protein